MQAGFEFLKIANQFGVHRSTVYRGASRNLGLRGYRPHKVTGKRRNVKATHQSVMAIVTDEAKERIGDWEVDTIIW